MKVGIRKTIEGLKSYMEKHTGLYYPGECGCEISDLAPCGEDHSLLFGYYNYSLYICRVIKIQNYESNSKIQFRINVGDTKNDK
jgi:hypothetical protein